MKYCENMRYENQNNFDKLQKEMVRLIDAFDK